MSPDRKSYEAIKSNVKRISAMNVKHPLLRLLSPWRGTFCSTQAMINVQLIGDRAYVIAKFAHDLWWCRFWSKTFLHFTHAHTHTLTRCPLGNIPLMLDIILQHWTTGRQAWNVPILWKFVPVTVFFFLLHSGSFVIPYNPPRTTRSVESIKSFKFESHRFTSAGNSFPRWKRWMSFFIRWCMADVTLVPIYVVSKKRNIGRRRETGSKHDYRDMHDESRRSSYG